MLRWSAVGALLTGLVGCSTDVRGVDSESHFVCSSDSECTRLEPGARCVHGACQVPQPALDASRVPENAARTSVARDAMASTGELPMEALATEQALPRRIAVDGASIYWLNLGQLSNPDTKSFSPYVRGTISKCSITGCGRAPTTLATDVSTYPGRTPFAVGKGRVYWGNETGDGNSYIMHCSAGSCSTPGQLTTSRAWALVTDTANLYWTTGETELSSCALSDCVPQTLSAFSNTGDTGDARLVADGAAVYWINVRDILKCDHGGCGTATPAVPPPALASKSQPFDIAVDDQYIYWTTWNLTTNSMLGVGAAGQIMRCEKSGCSAPVVIVDGLYSPTSIATDGTNVYWSENTEESCCSTGVGCCSGRTDVGRIAKCPVTGCDQPTPLVEHLFAASNLAVDASNVYFATLSADGKTGSVFRVPK